MGVTSTYALMFQRSKAKSVISAACIVAVAYLGLRWAIGLTETKNTQLLFTASTFSERLSMLPLILGHYIEIFFFPNRLSLATDFILKEFSWEQFWGPLLLVFAFLFSLGMLFLKSSSKNFFSFFLILFFYWFLLHTHLLIPLDGVYTDRWFYMGVWIMSSWFFLFFVGILSENYC